jgi:hypothetical protein
MHAAFKDEEFISPAWNNGMQENWNNGEKHWHHDIFKLDAF